MGEVAQWHRLYLRGADAVLWRHLTTRARLHRHCLYIVGGMLHSGANTAVRVLQTVHGMNTSLGLISDGHDCPVGEHLADILTRNCRGIRSPSGFDVVHRHRASGLGLRRKLVLRRC